MTSASAASRRRRRRHRALVAASPLVCLAITSVAYAQQPYTPVQLLSSGQHQAQDVYIIDPPASVSPNGQLRLLRPTSVLSSASLPAATLSNTLPFLSKDPSLAYQASTDGAGNINVVVSDCSQGVSASTVWTYTPNAQDATKQGTWAKKTISNPGSSSTANGEAVLNHLAQSITFTPTSKSNETIYTFGGMCPFKNATQDNWVSAATYSNQLTVLTQDSTSDFDFRLGTARGQPIAEAGFSITPLAPSYTNASDGSQAMAQSFLLLGGQTQGAFINMSQVALFSLPLASWTFFTVAADTAKTDLKARDVSVEPRSGHTAVLSPDGSKVIMFGGWVGETNSPAEPQLAVLNVGAGFGGNGAWSWAAEPSQPSFPAGSSGVYGHGAVMLDGGVMMVYGGNQITGAAPSKARRSTANTQALFYNTSSDQWINSYNPANVYVAPAPSPSATDNSSGGGDLSHGQSVGLGVGLSCGFVAVFAAAIAGYGLLKKSRKYNDPREPVEDQHDEHDTEIKDLAATANMPNEKDWGAVDDDRPGTGALAGQIWDGRGRTRNDGVETEMGVWINDSVRDAERTGLQLDIPSPQRGLRRSLASRSGRPGQGHVRQASGSVPRIAPIVEEDEAASPTHSDHEDPFRDPERPSTSTTIRPASSSVLAAAPALPAMEPVGSLFSQTMAEMSRWITDLGDMAQERTSTSASAPLEPAAARTQPHESPDQRERAIAEARMGEVPAAERPAQAPPPSLWDIMRGQASPRTLSSLSESAYSLASHVSAQSATSLTALTSSDRERDKKPDVPVGGMLRVVPPGMNPLASSPSPGSSPSGTSSPARSLPEPPQTAASRSGDSFATAHSGFASLQAESDALLGPARPGQAANLDLHTLNMSPDMNMIVEPDEEPTFTRANGRRAPSSRLGGWMGSVRRVLESAGRSTNAVLQAPRGGEARDGRDGLGGLMMYDTGSASAASSPTKSHGDLGLSFDGGGDGDGDADEEDARQHDWQMRRSQSESARLFGAKRGAADWGVGADVPEGGHEQRRRSVIGMPELELGYPSQHQQHRHPQREKRDALLDGGDMGVRRARSSSAGPAGGRGRSGAREEDDWDVEAAGRERNVQVMFSVPKERLRVVNADVRDDASVSDAGGRRES